MLALFAGCESDTIELSLKFEDSDSGRSLPYFIPHSIDLMPTDSLPAHIKLPEGTTPSLLSGAFRFGNTEKSIWFLLDKTKANALYHNRLLIDHNRDGDFSNDGAALLAQGRFMRDRNRHYIEFDRIKIQFPWKTSGAEEQETFSGKLYFWLPPDGEPAAVRLIRDSWRRGVFYETDSLCVVLVDDDCNGVFDTNDRWALFPADCLGTPFVSHYNMFRETTSPGWTGEQAWSLLEIAPRGDRVKLKRLQNAANGERQQKLSPYASEMNRPRAARNIRWQNSWSAAQRRARRVKRPLMLYFATAWSGPSSMMQERTFKDAEVLGITDEFICFKIDGDKDRALVQQFQISNFPAVVLLDRRSKEISRVNGYQTAADFAAYLRQYIPGSK